MNVKIFSGECGVGGGLQLQTVLGDLFTSPENVSLCHCVSRDFKMGSGIAVIFKAVFGRIQELMDTGAGVGGIAVLKDGKRFIYNLVTKEKCNDKPTYEDLQRSLESMREHAREHGVTSIAMPEIGCGLDRLQWQLVEGIIEKVFQQEKIKLTV